MGAAVEVEGTGLSTSTGADGTYTITGVPEGSYTVTASATGYVSFSEEAEVVAGATSILDFWLDPLGSAESGGED